jgi:hypothetical protein
LAERGATACDEGSGEACEQVDDACFAAGRVIGLGRVADACTLRLDGESTGVWEQTLEGCDDGSTTWLDLSVDAIEPAGGSVLVSYRLMQDVIVPVGLPWTKLDGQDVDLRSQTGRFLDVRVELRAAPDGSSPQLDAVHVERRCSAP